VNTLPWYVARASGFVGWGLLSASVLWGLAISGKATSFGRRPRPNWMLDLHRYLGGLATVFTAVHVAAVVADSYVHFDLASIVIPFASSWKPTAVAWGVVSMYLLLAVELTSLARKRLPRKAWRMVHFASFPLFVSATVHGFTAGTDGHNMAFVVTAAVVIVAVAGLTRRRVLEATGSPSQRVPARVTA
jgi:hypothetical protein